MADFVAVIRRTVDGLSENSPEMRAKVYEKARGAVRRQLENMKPRPSDEMIDRQMMKLEAAIGEVETDNSEAMPAEPDAPEAYFEQPPVPYDVSSAGQHAVEPEPEPVAPEVPVSAALPPEEPAPDDTPVRDEAFHDEPVAVAPPAVEVDEAEEAETAPVEVEPPEEAAGIPEPVATSAAPETPSDERHDDVSIAADERDAETRPVAGEPAPEVIAEPSYAEEPDHSHAYEHGVDPYPDTDQPVLIDDHAPAAIVDVPHPAEAYVEPAPETDARAMPAAEWELPEWQDPKPVGETLHFTAHLEPVRTEAADDVAILEEFVALARQEERAQAVDRDHSPVSGGLTPEGEPAHSWALDENDPFRQPTTPVAPESVEPDIADWSWPVDRSSVSTEVAPDETPDDRASTGWTGVDDLLGRDVSVSTAASGQVPDAERDIPVPVRPTSYRAEPKKSAFSLKRVAVAAVLLLAAGGSGYAYWTNRDDVDGWVSGLIASINAPPPQQAVTPSGDASAEGAADGASGSGDNGATAESAGPVPTKFTQRLQADGSEIDEGIAPTLTGAAAGQEGKSVAAQTEASRPVDTADATAVPPGAQTPTLDGAAGDAPASQTPAPAGQAQTTPLPTDTPPPVADQATVQMPAGAQKMFLYEERLGQTAPTAIEGGVAWSLKEETPEAGQRPEPVIQAQISVPDRGLTALMTIKRNSDTSLPASHTIEFVFSLPETFEGGSIDSVQRVAMKRNEQDRGDALIAVPAKITEDFHMIALNDFPEAVTTNLDLLRTRNWIDIPLTYRNGRRALLTLEKGPAGTEAFDKALSAWSAIRPAGQ